MNSVSKIFENLIFVGWGDLVWFLNISELELVPELLTDLTLE
jgi:hypothetical protein